MFLTWLPEHINQRFGVSVKVEDIIRYHTPYICMEEAKHYELYGYERRI